MLYSRTLLFTHPIYYSLPLLIWNTHSFLSFPVPPWQPQFFSLYLWICFCFIDMWICNDVNRPKDCHTKESKSETERQIPHDIIYMWHLKYDANQHISKKVTFNLILEKCLGDHLAEKTEKKIPFGKRPKGQNSELWKEVVCLDTWGLWGGGKTTLSTQPAKSWPTDRSLPACCSCYWASIIFLQDYCNTLHTNVYISSKVLSDRVNHLI